MEIYIVEGLGEKREQREFSAMGRAPCCNGEHAGLKKGPWTHEEDEKLKAFILAHPSTSWRLVPLKAGLIRCGKSCRLRWMNYLRPDIRRGNFSPEEEELIIQLHSAVGNKWSVIAAQLPGRTDNEIKNLWNTKLKKILVLKGINPLTHQPLCNSVLSDYVRQCLRSLEHMLISRFVGQTPVSEGNGELSLPPPASISTVQSVLDGLDQRFDLPESSSTLERRSPGCDSFLLDLFLGDDSLLPGNGSLNDLVAGASGHLGLRDLPDDLAGQGLWN